jgi:hypothetical protein
MLNPSQVDQYEQDVMPAGEYDEEVQPETPSWANEYNLPDPPRIMPWNDIAGAPFLERARTQAIDEFIPTPQPPPEPAAIQPFVFILPPTTGSLVSGQQYTFIAKYNSVVDPFFISWTVNGANFGIGDTVQLVFTSGPVLISITYDDGSASAEDQIAFEITPPAQVGGVWSGHYWFGGEVVEVGYGGIKSYFGCNLRTGQVQFSDEPFDEDNIEWRYVADKNEETGEYTLSNRTCGDIVFRIT